MKKAAWRIGILRGLFLCAVSVGLVSATGCPGTPEVPEAPSQVEARQRSLEDLKGRLAANSRSLNTLTADVEATVISPILQPQRIQLTGRLAVATPGRIYLALRRPGRVHVELIGDGISYRAKVFGSSYSGTYGEPLSGATGRVHFLPEDLADCFDLTRVLVDRSQVLRAYPRRGDIVAGSFREPAIYPPTWSIDSVAVEEKPRPRVWTSSSVLIDRRTEQVLRLDKFRSNGQLRTRAWFVDPGMVTGPGGAMTRVPDVLMLWYPPPLEGTIIYMRLSNTKLNTPVPAKTFRLTE